MSAHDAITHRVKRVVRQVSPAAFAERSAARKIVQQFAEQAGLIYFGTINPRDDDYHPIRGYTMSTTHATGTIAWVIFAVIMSHSCRGEIWCGLPIAPSLRRSDG